MLNNAKPYFFLNELNKKDLPATAMYSTALLRQTDTKTHAVEYIAGKFFFFNSFKKSMV